MAQSIMDYIFRRLALDYLPEEDRAGLGIFTAEERIAQAAGYDTTVAPTALPTADADLESLAQSVPVATPHHEGPSKAHSSAELLEEITGKTNDAPLCMTCGIKMRPAGSCYVCEGCGSTSGCS
jgi:ribonucleoside-diphosphate reductase alpha chain